MLSSCSSCQLNINLCWTLPRSPQTQLVWSWRLRPQAGLQVRLMSGHRQTEPFVLANHFDQKQSANVFVIHRIFLSIWNTFLKKIIFLYLSFFFLNNPQSLQNKSSYSFWKRANGQYFQPSSCRMLRGSTGAITQILPPRYDCLQRRPHKSRTLYGLYRHWDGRILSKRENGAAGGSTLVSPCQNQML